MQPLKGATRAGVNISFGMLNFAVSVHAAVGDDDSLPTKTVCLNAHEATPINQKYVCPECSSEDRASFVKAAETATGWDPIPVELIEQEKAAAVPFQKNVTLTPHPASQVSGVLLPSGKSYYLSLKGSAGADAYTLMSRIVRERSDLAFMAKFALRSVVSIVQLTVAGDGTLVFTQMTDASLVRVHPVIAFTEPSEGELDLAMKLADLLTTDFVESAHGSGKTMIIANYIASLAGPEPAQVAAALPSSVVSMADKLEAMVAAAAAAKTEAEARRAKGPANRKAG